MDATTQDGFVTNNGYAKRASRGSNCCCNGVINVINAPAIAMITTIIQSPRCARTNAPHVAASRSFPDDATGDNIEVGGARVDDGDGDGDAGDG
jgi:hypothetical protein